MSQALLAKCKRVLHHFSRPEEDSNPSTAHPSTVHPFPHRPQCISHQPPLTSHPRHPFRQAKDFSFCELTPKLAAHCRSHSKSLCCPTEDSESTLFSHNLCLPLAHPPRYSATPQASRSPEHQSFIAPPDQCAATPQRAGGRPRSNSLSLDTSSNALSRTKPYVSPYSRQTRLERIMRLKVKPGLRTPLKPHADRSASSLAKSSLDVPKQPAKAKENRLEKIMRLKVTKPVVGSKLRNCSQRKSVSRESESALSLSTTLLNSKDSSQASKSSKWGRSSSREWIECVKALRCRQAQEDKENRLWQDFERERGLREAEKKKAAAKEFERQRRQERRFDRLVEKEVEKLERERAVSLAKRAWV